MFVLFQRPIKRSFLGKYLHELGGGPRLVSIRTLLISVLLLVSSSEISGKVPRLNLTRGFFFPTVKLEYIKSETPTLHFQQNFALPVTLT